MVDLAPGRMRLRTGSPRWGEIEVEVPDRYGSRLAAVVGRVAEVRYDEYPQPDGSRRLIAWQISIVADHLAAIAEAPPSTHWRDLARAQGIDPNEPAPDWGGIFRDLFDSEARALQFDRHVRGLRKGG